MSFFGDYFTDLSRLDTKKEEKKIFDTIDVYNSQLLKLRDLMKLVENMSNISGVQLLKESKKRHKLIDGHTHPPKKFSKRIPYFALNLDGELKKIGLMLCPGSKKDGKMASSMRETGNSKIGSSTRNTIYKR